MNKKRDSNKPKFIRIKQVVRWFFGILFLLFFIGGTIITIWISQNYGAQIADVWEKADAIAEASSEEDFKLSQTTLVYAADGELISTVKGEKDVYYLEYAFIPQTVIDALIISEDRKFYDHPGYDLKANIRAAYSYIKNDGMIYQGASTITQQLARNIYLTTEVTMERKVTEILLAAKLEKLYSKQQILEFYLNNIYFANGYYGIQAAANGYFNTGVSKLSLSQMVFLCAIPNSPTQYDPNEHFDKAIDRRDRILLQMYEGGMISDEEYKAACKEKIVLCESTQEIKDYAETYSYFCAIRALMKQRGFQFRTVFLGEEDKERYETYYYEEYYAVQRSLFTGGYRIYTSIDLKKQELLQAVIDEELSGFSETNEEGVYALQGAAVCIDNDTGRVTAIIGGREQDIGGYTFNRAYQSLRQPGSAIKPLIVYTPQFERGYYPEDLVVDEKFEGGPKNAGGSYSGEITLRRAIELSRNTVAWKMFEELTPKVGLSYLLNMNFAGIVESDYTTAASIGGFAYGVSAVEMAAGFAAIENDGNYRMPTCIVCITDAQGNPIIAESIESVRIYSQNAARIMTDVLTGVMTQGTGKKLSLDTMISAGKTGTASESRDGWFIGYTGYYTTSVWVGYDLPKTLDDLAGNTYPGAIWKKYMNEIHAGYEPVEFAEYVDMRPAVETEEAGTETGTETGEGQTGEGQIGEGQGTQGITVDGQIAQDQAVQNQEADGISEETNNLTGNEEDGADGQANEQGMWFDSGYEQENSEQENSEQDEADDSENMDEPVTNEDDIDANDFYDTKGE